MGGRSEAGLRGLPRCFPNPLHIDSGACTISFETPNTLWFHFTAGVTEAERKGMEELDWNPGHLVPHHRGLRRAVQKQLSQTFWSGDLPSRLDPSRCGNSPPDTRGDSVSEPLGSCRGSRRVPTFSASSLIPACGTYYPPGPSPESAGAPAHGLSPTEPAHISDSLEIRLPLFSRLPSNCPCPGAGISASSVFSESFESGV